MNGSKRTRANYRIISLAVLVALACTNLSANDIVPMRTYRVTVQNLTEGQALTPPVIATHAYGFRFFTVGQAAGPELQAIAENGNSGPMNALLSADSRVLSIAESSEGPLVPASNPGNTSFTDAVTLMTDADPSARFLSAVSMLICTNDGFTGFNSIPLPEGGTRVLLTSGYDAGTEMNTEDYADLVPPCQALFAVTSGKMGTDQSNPALAENGVVAYHGGIQGTADLPATRDWANPVAKITITSVDPLADRFSATLSGAGEVPPVFTFATGSATFRLREQSQELDYELNVSDISGVLQAHIHHGPPNENRGVVAFLYGPQSASGMLKGELASGTITAADLRGDLAGNWDGFVAALRNGETYANVHTADNPGGHIRGQIGAVPRGGTSMP